MAGFGGEGEGWSWVGNLGRVSREGVTGRWDFWGFGTDGRGWLGLEFLGREGEEGDGGWDGYSSSTGLL